MEGHQNGEKKARQVASGQGNDFLGRSFWGLSICPPPPANPPIDASRGALLMRGACREAVVVSVQGLKRSEEQSKILR